ncbi:unnamed protein product [Candidula unifasciata]|uniref:Mitochondrial ribosomal protein L55 n=1 Tax=Candidula unifasciata TaxID=100452 RepID=A0A8S3ZL60_9EUPU|nr:unnamed protein product [Candidula unifasciata]
MAAPIRVLRCFMPSGFAFLSTARTPTTEFLSCIRNTSTAIAVTTVKRSVYPRLYPTVLVFPDGSTLNIQYRDPRKIVKLPVDFSKLSEAEKRQVLLSRKPKQKLEKIEDFGESIDISEYSKYFNQ